MLPKFTEWKQKLGSVVKATQNIMGKLEVI